MEQKAFEYYAFISYSRLDEEWAKWIQRKLETYRFPVTLRKNNASLPKKIFPVFRDKTDLVSGELWDSLKHQLQESEYLIVICSPNSAKAEWVNNEVAYFRSLGRNNKIIPLIVDGNPHAADPQQECFCPMLRDCGEDELLGVSIKELGKKKAVLRVISGMMQLRFDSLVKRDTVRRRRRAMLAAAVAVMLTVWGGLTIRMTKDPAASVSLAESALIALQEQNIYTAYEQGAESIGNLFRKTDYDPGVIALKSAAITKAFCDADPFPHKVISLEFSTKDDQRWIGNSTDNTVIVMFNGTNAFTYDAETGKLLGEYPVISSDKDKAYIIGLLGIDADTDLYTYADSLRVKNLKDQQIGTLNDHTLNVSCGGETYLFPVEDTTQYCAVVNAENSVAAVYDGKETVNVKCKEGNFSRTFTIPNQLITRMYLSPKGNLLVLSYRTSYDNQLNYKLYDLSYNAELTTLSGSETDTRTTDFFIFDEFTDFFYFYVPYHFSKYVYRDQIPNDALSLVCRNDSYAYNVVLSPDCKTGFLHSDYTKEDRYIVFNTESGESIFEKSIMFQNFLDDQKMFSLDPNMELISYITDNKFIVYDVKNGKEIYSEEKCGYQACAISEDAMQIVAATTDNEVFLYKIEEGSVRKNDSPVLMSLPVSEELFFLGIHGNIICATTQRKMTLYDLQTKELVSEQLDKTSPFRGNITSSFLSGNLIFLDERDSHTQHIYDVERKEFVSLEAEYSSNMYCSKTGMLFSQTEYDMYEGTYERNMYTYQNGELEKVYSFNTTYYSEFCFDSSGKYLIGVEYRDGAKIAVVLEATTGKELLCIPNHRVWISDGYLYDTSISYVPIIIPKAKFYTVKEIAVLAKKQP